ncbi:MAG: hypothetical protein H7Y17_14530 [Chlorobia bacterium]|nr:hypothetical protein [Fimbriimonadaceae bacterium]
MEASGGKEVLVGQIVITTSSGGSVRKSFNVCMGGGVLALAFGIAFSEPMALVYSLIGPLVALTLAPIAYMLGSEALICKRAWWNGRRLPYRSIERIVPIFPYGDFTRPAAMHMVVYNGQKVYLCAKDQPQLLSEILLRAPHLRLFGYEWRREFTLDSLNSGSSG